MNRDFREYLIQEGTALGEALIKLEELAADAILFTVDEEGRLTGSLTDGDVRRGIIDGLSRENAVEDFAQDHPKFIRKPDGDLEHISQLRKGGYKVIPIVDQNKRVVDVLNFRYTKTYLPLDAVIMAGGRGERLKPLTDETPKPLLKIGDKPILDHIIQRLVRYGITDLWLSIRYKADKIERYVQNCDHRNLSIRYIHENKPLGTAGSLSLVEDLQHEHLLVMNSDILTDIDFEEFYLHFRESGADLAVAAVPYSVEVPYAVLETSDERVISFKEKPTYTYHSSAGMYVMNRQVLDYIPEGEFFDVTDLIEELLEADRKVVTFPFSNYWLDIGKPEDYRKAQEEIKHLTSHNYDQ